MCPICGGAYVLGSDLHRSCRIEQEERRRDLELLRSLRRACEQRGIKYSDFIAQLMNLITSKSMNFDFEIDDYEFL